MKRTFLLAAAVVALTGGRAQEAARIHRTEVIPYDTRHDADARARDASGHTIPFAPEAVRTDGASVVFEARVEIPYVWTDGVIYLHLQQVGTAYTLRVNGREAGRVEDGSTPAQFDVSPFVREGANSFEVTMRRSAVRLDTAPAQRSPFGGSYLYFQNKRSIRDFEIALVPDTAGRRFGMLDLKIVARNGFNYPETVTVGYDIYSPQGKLLDFNIVDTRIEGRSTDTVRFSPYIYHTFENLWKGDAKHDAPLYKVMLFTRRDGTYREYMPLRIGFGRPRLLGDALVWPDGTREAVSAQAYDAAADASTTEKELRALKTKGFNLITPSRPQPAWFYETCDALGLAVVDRANIHAPERRLDRRVGGTPANDPALAAEFLERVQAMYYRSRNFTCVVAFALGGPSGNGYNMYKAYEWLKSVERERPVVYEDADGEWNSDIPVWSSN